MNQADGTISFFYDPQRPLIDASMIKRDDLTAAIIGGVDLGLSCALIEYAEDKVAEHEALAVRAFHAGDEELGEHHTRRAYAWDELRREAEAAFIDIARRRAN